MSAFSDAQKLYTPSQLGEIIAFCGDYGFVYCTQTAFLCAAHANYNSIETKYKLDLDKSNAWFIFIASGDPIELFNASESRKYIIFERFDGRTRVLDSERTKRLINGKYRR